MTPVHRRSQRSMSRQRRARTVGQQCEALIEPVVQFADRHRAQPRRGQFDGQGHAVEPGADRCDGGGVGSRQVEIGTYELRALDEEAHGFVLRDDLLCRCRSRFRHGQRRHAIREFSRHPQALAAGREDDNVRTPPEDLVEQSYAAFEHVLCVVDHQQHLPRCQGFDHDVGHRSARLFLEGQRLRHRPRHLLRIRQAREFHQEDAVAKCVEGPTRRLDREPGLARPAGTGQRDQPMRGEQRLEPCDLVFAAYEARQLMGKLVPDRHRRRGRRFGFASEYGRNESIPLSRHCADGVGTDHLAQRRQLHAQCRVLDHDVGPDATEQFVLRDEVSGAIEERQEQVEGA